MSTKSSLLSLIKRYGQAMRDSARYTECGHDEEADSVLEEITKQLNELEGLVTLGLVHLPADVPLDLPIVSWEDY